MNLPDHRFATALLLVGSLVATALPAGAVSVPAEKLIDNYNRTDVVEAYVKTMKQALKVPTGWTGNLETCLAGTISDESRQATVSAINYMRAMADLPPVKALDSLNTRAQESALIIDANKVLTHYPPSTSLCYTETGYLGASNGNIASADGSEIPGLSTATGARAVLLYMEDADSSNYPVGHRRWLLYPPLTQVGIGDTANANTVVVVGGKLAKVKKKKWTMWPAPGFFPRELNPYGRWSISYPGANFKNAKIEVSTPSGPAKVEKLPLEAYIGDNTLAWDTTFPDDYPNLRDDYKVVVTVSGVKIAGKTVSKRYAVTLVDADPEYELPPLEQ